MTRSPNPYRNKLSEVADLVLPFDQPIDETVTQCIAERISNFKSVICELGSGSGGHLLDIAASDRSTLFVGFEIRYKRIYRCAIKARNRDISNILLLRTYAQSLPDFFKAGSLAGVYVNFPDPWDKPRWEKHKLLTGDFLEVLVKILGHNGFLSFKTDHAEYFESVSNLVQSHSLLRVESSSRDLHAEQSPPRFGETRTEFENLFISKGLPVHHLVAIKVGR